eukprot:TRINITY_DN60086_c0_g1_i1.p1 TRINITY_DN60086_c0_g1~~TRINITY_DN60086_c0_g1_i1.p1  ORF type:complete len:561 (+),score=172.13 TRINITY_DN60086_c0_g1_i1:75-1685(+)
MGPRLVAAVMGIAVSAAGLDNGLALTPGMGFNTWNQLGCDFNETRVRAIADAMRSQGYVAAGYRYLVLDDCWMDRQRDAQGEWQMDLRRFPSGAAALVKYLNGRGVELGVYSSAGPKTCQGLPASLGSEHRDAATIARWGVSFLKYDNCGSEGITEDEQRQRHQTMRDALNATGKRIYFSLSEWNGHRGSPADWVRPTANSWRTGGDIAPHWDAVTYQLDSYAQFAPANLSGPGGWGDPDMLEVGVYVHGEKPQFLTDEEARSHMALWCVLKAPLMMGGDPTLVASSARELLLNRHAIAINQDALGIPGRRVAAAPPPAAAAADGGAAVVAADCTGAGAEPVRWQGTTLVRGGDCLTADPADRVPSTGNPSLRWAPCSPGSEQQQWSNRTGMIAGSGGLCVEIAWAHSSAGSAVELNTCSGWASELWDAEAAGMRSRLNSSNCLGVGPAPSPSPPPQVSGEVWYAPLSGGAVAAVLLNRGDSAASVAVVFADVGLGDAAAVRVTDVWTQGSLGVHKGSFSAAAAPHGAAFVHLSPA